MTVTLKVPTMVCEACVETVSNAIITHEPQAKIDVNLDTKEVTVNTEASEESVRQMIVATGHEVE
jgi:copper chaperone